MLLERIRNSKFRPVKQQKPKPYLYKPLKPVNVLAKGLSHISNAYTNAQTVTFLKHNKVTTGPKNYDWGSSEGRFFTDYGSYFITLEVYSFFLSNHFFSKLQASQKDLRLVEKKLTREDEDYASIRGTTFHNLIIIFKHNKLTIVLADRNNKCYFYLQTGLLLKFFRHKKSIKKTKTAKVLLFKYLRKLLNLMMLRTFILYVRGSPKNLPELIRVLRKPFTHTYTDPFTNVQVDETTVKSSQFPRFKFTQLFFVNSTPFGKMKTKPRGRLKRRIRKKIVKMNNVPD